MWIKCKKKGDLVFLNLEKVMYISLVTGSNEQYIVVEFDDGEYKIFEYEIENFEEIKQKLMGLDNENYDEEQA